MLHRLLQYRAVLYVPNFLPHHWHSISLYVIARRAIGRTNHQGLDDDPRQAPVGRWVALASQPPEQLEVLHLALTVICSAVTVSSDEMIALVLKEPCVDLEEHHLPVQQEVGHAPFDFTP